MPEALIAGYVRSPFAPASRGELARVRPDDLAARVISALIERTGIDPDDVEDLLLGCAFPEGEQGLNLARLVGFLSGLPQGVAGATVNRFCGSSMQSVHMAAGAVALGAGEAFICAGVESMSRVPMAGFNPLPNPPLFERMPEAGIQGDATSYTTVINACAQVGDVQQLLAGTEGHGIGMARHAATGSQRK